MKEPPWGSRFWTGSLDKYEPTIPYGTTPQSKLAYNKESARLYTEFRKDALEHVGLTDHPKADKAFALAYSNGHAQGYSEVLNLLEDYAELVK